MPSVVVLPAPAKAAILSGLPVRNLSTAICCSSVGRNIFLPSSLSLQLGASGARLVPISPGGKGSAGVACRDLPAGRRVQKIRRTGKRGTAAQAEQAG